MSQRFFVDTPITSGMATLADAEAHHLTHVMRAKVGDQITLFDGSGAEFTASIASIGRREVTAEVQDRLEVNREAACQLTLAVALPKGDRQRWLIEKAVELGVAELVPLAAARGAPGKGSSGGDRLWKAVIEASKQCGRNRLMKIAEPRTPAEFFAECPSDTLRLIAHPAENAGDPKSAGALLREADPLASVALAIGPEGGFTDEEVQTASGAGWRSVSLGRRILRIETAALALASLALLGR